MEEEKPAGPEARHEWAGGADGRARGPFLRRLKGSGDGGERAAGLCGFPARGTCARPLA